MCIHRSRNCSACSVSIDVEETYSDDKWKGVYKMSIHRSCNCSYWIFTIEVGISYLGDKRNGV